MEIREEKETLSWSAFQTSGIVFATISVPKVGGGGEVSVLTRCKSSRNSYRDPGKISQCLLCGYGERRAVVVGF